MRIILVFLAAIFTLAGCDTIPTGIRSASEPSIGYIVFVGDLDGRRNLFRQDMDGISPVGAPVKIYDLDIDTADGAFDARYPTITKDGRFIVFVSRSTNFTTSGGSGAFDSVNISDFNGNIIDALEPNSSGCRSTNYPDILDYEYIQLPTPSEFRMLIAFTCVDDYPNRRAVINAAGARYGGYFDASPPVGPPGDGIVNGLDSLSPTEFAAHPNYSADTGGIIFSAHNKRIIVSEFTHNQPGNDYIGSSNVHISASQHRIGGICKNGSTTTISDPTGGTGTITIPCTVEQDPVLRDGFDISVSADGTFLMYNSEAFDNNPQRNEELFVINLPSGTIREAYDLTTTSLPNGTQLPGPGRNFVSTINELPHINDQRNHYGQFAINGLHQFVINTKSGDGLWVAENLTAPPIQIPLPANMKAVEAVWYYKEQ